VPGVYVGARSSALAPDGIVRPVLVSVLVASALALLIPDNPQRLAWAFAIVLLTAIPLWGAVDATLRPHADWEAAGHSRTRWVAVQGIGAPFLIGFVASLVYFFDVRRQVVSAQLRSTREVAPALAGSGPPRRLRLGRVPPGRVVAARRPPRRRRSSR